MKSNDHNARLHARTQQTLTSLAALLSTSPDGLRIAEMTHIYGVGVRGMEKYLNALRQQGLAGWARIGDMCKWTGAEHLEALRAHGKAVAKASKQARERRKHQRRRHGVEIPEPTRQPRLKALIGRVRTYEWPREPAEWTPPTPLVPSVWHYAQMVGNNMGASA